MIELGVNIDHVATLRQARGTVYPSPVEAALSACTAGADAITLHLREDRRHIQDADVEILRQVLPTRMNLECALTEEMIGIALRIRPSDVCLVPERREERTTEGGLDVVGNLPRLTEACARLQAEGIRVSLFIAPDLAQIQAAARSGAGVVELHTGAYAHAHAPGARARELDRIITAGRAATDAGLKVNAGHGLNYHNVGAVAALAEIAELNIGHAIVAQAVFTGWMDAVRDMKALMLAARRP